MPVIVSSHFRRHLAVASVLLLAGCQLASNDAKRDTATRPADPAGAIRADTMPPSGVAAVPADSVVPAAPADTGIVLLSPERPRRGDVVFALARGLSMTQPRCTWKGAPLPCYTSAEGVLAIIPLAADEPAGTYAVTFDRPVGRITREIVVADRDFGRELVILPDSLYRLVTRTADVARDARATLRVLRTETPERSWRGAWREPVAAPASERYGIERLYLRASDSARSIPLAAARFGGAFAGDTATQRGDGPPGWRHAGVDRARPLRSPVIAPVAGTVANVGDYVLSGRTLLLDHGQGVFTAYFHLDTALVRDGDVVRAGQTIARVGATGLATGPHLHYGVYVHGRDVDPASWRRIPEWARQ